MGNYESVLFLTANTSQKSKNALKIFNTVQETLRQHGTKIVTADTFHDEVNRSEATYKVLVAWQSVRDEDLWLECWTLVQSKCHFAKAVVIIDDDKGGNKTSEILGVDGVSAYFIPSFRPEVLFGYIETAIQQVFQDELLANFENDVKNLTAKKISEVIFEHLAKPEFLGFDRCAIALIATNTPNRVRSLLDYKATDKSQVEYDLLRPLEEDALIRDVLDRKLKNVWHDCKNDKPHDEFSDEIGSWVVIPLEVSGEPIGVITVDKLEARQSLPVTPATLRRFGEIAGLAIDRAENARNWTFVQEISRAINTEHDIEKLLNKILEYLCTRLDCRRCTYFVRKEIGGEDFLEEWVTFSHGREEKEKHFSFKRGENRVGGKLLVDGSPRLIPDVLKDREFGVIKDYPKKREGSLLAVPVTVQISSQGKDDYNRIIGAFFLDKDVKMSFSGYDLELLKAIANQAATLIERTLMLNLVQDTSTHIQDFDEPSKQDEILESIITNAMRLTNATAGVIHLVNEETPGNYVYVKKYGLPLGFGHPTPTLNKDSITYDLIHSKKREPKVFEKITLKQLVDKGMNIAIGIPLVTANEKRIKVHGVLYLNSPTKSGFNDVEQASLKLFASHAAIALSATNLLNERETQGKLRERLYEAGLEIAKLQTRVTSIDETLQYIAQTVLELVGEKKGEERQSKTRYTHILLEQGERLIFHASWPDYHLSNLKRKFPDGLSLKEDDDLFGIGSKAFTDKQPVLADDITKPPEGVKYVKYRDETRSELAVPILKSPDEKPLGVINIEHGDFKAFTEVDVSIVQLFANFVAVSIEQMNLREAAEQARKRLKDLSKAIESVITLSDSEQVLERIVLLTKEATKSDWVSILFFDVVKARRDSLRFRVKLPFIDKRGQVKIARVVTHDIFRTLEPHLRADGISVQVFRSGKPKHIENIEVDRHVNNIVRKQGMKSAICLPLKGRERQIGVMWLHYRDYKGKQDFEPEQIEILQLYANQASAVYDIIARQFGSVNESIAKNIQEDYEDMRATGRSYYFLSFAVAVLGFAFIVAGIWNLRVGEGLSAIPIIVGAITEVASVLVFTRAEAAYKRLDLYHKERLHIKQLENLLTACNQLPTPEQRDACKDSVIRQASTLWFGSSANGGVTASPSVTVLPPDSAQKN